MFSIRHRSARCCAGLRDWVHVRAPGLSAFLHAQGRGYFVPKNFNVWYLFGILALVALVNQVVTGLFLAMHYQPSTAEAFHSVEMTIMRDVEWGWLIRYLHSTGASLLFVVLYLHMFRGLMYGSYHRPRELVWVLGMLAWGVLMAEAFMGYVLPWGQMSFWGAKVVISLFGAIPVIGEGLAEWIMGDYLPSDATLGRFFALHVVGLPLLLLVLVGLHVMALRQVGSGNPDGVEIKDGPVGNRWSPTAPADGVPFHPYYTAKDLFYVCSFLLLGAAIVFFLPTFGGWFLEPDNFAPANRLSTPEHIRPAWYYLPFYAMLRAVPGQLGGLLVVGGAFVLLFLLPWIDRGKVRSIRCRGRGFTFALLAFALTFIGLGGIGAGPGAHRAEIWAGRVLTVAYFGYFVFLFVYTQFGFEKPRVPPERVTGHG